MPRPGAFPFMKVIPHNADSVYNFLLFCPGCKCDHGFRTADHPEPPGLDPESQKNFRDHKWKWNGNPQCPTIEPSLHIHFTNSKGERQTSCHCVVTNGKISFCIDSPHSLSGQTVDLPDYQE